MRFPNIACEKFQKTDRVSLNIFFPPVIEALYSFGFEENVFHISGGTVLIDTIDTIGKLSIYLRLAPERPSSPFWTRKTLVRTGNEREENTGGLPYPTNVPKYTLI